MPASVELNSPPQGGTQYSSHITFIVSRENKSIELIMFVGEEIFSLNVLCFVCSLPPLRSPVSLPRLVTGSRSPVGADALLP